MFLTSSLLLWHAPAAFQGLGHRACTQTSRDNGYGAAFTCCWHHCTGTAWQEAAWAPSLSLPPAGPACCRAAFQSAEAVATAPCCTRWPTGKAWMRGVAEVLAMASTLLFMLHRLGLKCTAVRRQASASSSSQSLKQRMDRDLIGKPTSASGQASGCNTNSTDY